MRVRSPKRIAILLAIVVGGLGAATYVLAAGTRMVQSPEDLRAFYCAGEAIDTHRDPYLAEPLRSCEVRETRAAGEFPFVNLAIPAPLPGYALVPFEALARLGFARASTLFFFLQVAACSASAVLLVRVTRFPFVGAFAALFMSVGMLSVEAGQIFPFALLAICACAQALLLNRYTTAAIFAACATIEPHTALPALIALFWWLPRIRIPLALCAAFLAIVTFATLGAATNVEYFAHVLPAQVLAEAASGRQFSLLTLLVHANIPLRIALTIADAEFLAMCVLGAFVARRLAVRYAAPEFYALVPPAFGALGGPYVHLTQLAIAIPAVLALLHRDPKHRNVYGAALLLLAIPWFTMVDDDLLEGLLTVAIVSVAIAIAVWRQSARTIIVAVTLTLLLTALERLDRLQVRSLAPSPDVAINRVSGPGLLAQASWQAYVDATARDDANATLVWRLPTWIGLLALTAAGTRAATRRRQTQTP